MNCYDMFDIILEKICLVSLAIEMILEIIFIGSLFLGVTFYALSILGKTVLFLDVVAHCAALLILIWYGAPVVREDLIDRFSL